MTVSPSNIALKTPTTADDSAPEAPVQSTTDLDLHLRVVGGLLEEHRVYHGARLQAVKDAVLRIFRDLAPESLSVRRIQEVLCYQDVPLVSESVLRQAVNELERKDAKLKAVSKKPKQYVLTCVVAPSADSLRELIEGSWRRHFKTCKPSLFPNFQRCIALLFARYGCAAYETLTSRGAPSVRLGTVFEHVDLPSSDRREFADSFSEFIISPDPADATLKVKLASAYALLRMNGAGNWGQDELRAFFSGRGFVVDTNVLFELMSRNVGQVTKMFRQLQQLGARFVVGSETLKEFETALRAVAEQVIAATSRGVDLVGLADAQVVRADWVRALCADHRSPSRKQVHDRVELLLKQVDGMLEAAGVDRVHLERSADTKERLARIARIQELALETRPYDKRDEVARHDALLWEAVAEEPRLADMVLTLDRSLGRIKCGEDRLAIMLDEVVAYSLMGGAGESELVELFGHALSQDLYPNAPFLQIEDILSIAGMEAKLLTGPARALRRAAAELSTVRAKRVGTGETISDDEVGRILIATIPSYQDDRIVAQHEREAADAARTRADREAEERARAQGEAASANERAARAERERQEQAKSAEQRVGALEASVEVLRGERATLQAEITEKNRRALLETAEQEVAKQARKKQRDWMLFVGALCFIAVGAMFAGVIWAASVAAVVAVVVAVWTALAEETPTVSLPVVTIVVVSVVAGAGIAEKWPQARALLRLPSPVAPSLAPAPAPSPL